MAKYVAKTVVQHIIKNSGDVKSSKVLIKGATFKENVSDIRNSKVADVVKALKSYYVNVDVEDPHADSDELQHEYGFGLVTNPGNDYDAVIVTVPHNDYKELGDEYFASITKAHGMVADLKGIYRNRITNTNLLEFIKCHFNKTDIPGLLVFEPDVFEDSRGYFFESYNEKIFQQEGIDFRWVQDNQSSSAYGVIRGLHYQLPPFAQSKLIRVLKGKILDVAVDIRKGHLRMENLLHRNYRQITKNNCLSLPDLHMDFLC